MTGGITDISDMQGVTEIDRANSRRLGNPLPQVHPSEAAKWQQKGFNFYDERLMGGRWAQEEGAATICEFFRSLAVCHTIIPDGALCPRMPPPEPHA